MKALHIFRHIGLAATLAAGLAVSTPAVMAQEAGADAAPADPAQSVVARINGVDITEADLQLAAQDLRESIMQIPAPQRLQALLNGLIDMKLMSAAAVAANLDDDAEVKRRVDFMHDKAFQAEYLKANIVDKITPESLRTAYDAEVAAFVPEEEVRASHIMLDNEEDAKAVIAELDGGADFATLAKEKSLDLGSGANGGDLDYFNRARMTPPFAEAAFSLEPGTYTKTPVQSEFGWHVILVVDKRMSSPPSFEAREPALREQEARRLFLAEVEKLRAAAEIEILLPEAQPPAEAPAAPAEETAPE